LPPLFRQQKTMAVVLPGSVFKKESMRKPLEWIGLAVLAVLVGITVWALYGPVALPARIPTHFNAAGQPDSWGNPSSLWLLPVVAMALYGLISAVQHFPSAFNLPRRVSPANRARLEAITLHMISWVKLELACLFLFIQWSIVESVRGGKASIPPLIAPIFLVVVFATVITHAVALFRAVRGRA
jgi:uncharacterized membrane protein